MTGFLFSRGWLTISAVLFIILIFGVNNLFKYQFRTEMERTVEIFNRNRKERETERLFYEMLLNRIDFCILVINR
ncbi:MAG: hypothetical protein LBD53_01980, partial [Tannerella sp.]|nr:hypothetical protein [Tannerella sp.]